VIFAIPLWRLNECIGLFSSTEGGIGDEMRVLYEQVTVVKSLVVVFLF
jgi:hypothetical protein